MTEGVTRLGRPLRPLRGAGEGGGCGNEDMKQMGQNTRNTHCLHGRGDGWVWAEGPRGWQRCHRGQSCTACALLRVLEKTTESR